MSPLPRCRRAFSLIELTVVLVILTVILALAFSSLASTTAHHDDTLAVTNLDDVVLAEVRFAMSSGTFTSHPADLRLSDGLSVTRASSSGSSEVSVAVGVNGTLGVAVWSPTRGVCHARRITTVSASQPTVVRVAVPAGAACAGAAALPQGEAADPTTGSRR